MTFSQQKNRMHRSGKKQLRIRGRITSLKGVSGTHLSRVCNHASFSERMEGVVWLRWRSPRRSIFAALSSNFLIAHSLRGACFRRELFIKCLVVSIKNHAWQTNTGSAPCRLARSVAQQSGTRRCRPNGTTRVEGEHGHGRLFGQWRAAQCDAQVSHRAFAAVPIRARGR